MIAWNRASQQEQAGRPWATWGLLATTLGVEAATASGIWPVAGLALDAAAPRLPALLGHLFLHPGTLPLLATLFFTATAGPRLERELGGRLAVTSYLAAGLAGAAWLAATRTPETPLWLGGSAAVAGWVGLLAAATRADRCDWLAFAAGRLGSLTAPGFGLAALWLGAELATWLAGEPEVAATRAVGFGFGAALGVGFERSGLAKRALREGPARKATTRRRGTPEPAALPSDPAQLEALLAGSADPAAAGACLRRAADEGRGEEVRQQAIACLRDAIEWRRREPAVALWCGLVASGPAPALEGEALLQLASWLRAAGHTSAASTALFAALAAADAAAAARIARAARRAEPVVCCRAVERALADGTLGGSERKALEALHLEAERELSARGVILVPGEAPSRPPEPRDREIDPHPSSRVAPPARALAFGEAIELSPREEIELTPDGRDEARPIPLALPDPAEAGEAAFLDAFHAALEADDEPKPVTPPRPERRLRVREAMPRALEADALVLEVPGRGPLRLRFSRIHAVALAGVRGLSARGSDRPVLLVDLCLSPEAEPELNVLRLRSDRFDPRRLAPGAADSPLAALRAFVAALASAAHAPLLPEAQGGDAALRVFPDLARYEREVLGAAA